MLGNLTGHKEAVVAVAVVAVVVAVAVVEVEMAWKEVAVVQPLVPPSIIIARLVEMMMLIT